MLRQEVGIGIVGAEHQQQLGVLDRVDTRLAADHPDAADPVRIAVRQQLLSPVGMRQRRLQPVRQRHELRFRTAAAGTAQHRDALRILDQRRRRRDVLGRGGDRRTRAKRGNAGHRPGQLRRENVGRNAEMSDAARAIGLRDRLVEDGRCLLRRAQRLGVNRDIAEQQVGIVLLGVVGAAQIGRHAS